MIQRLLPYRSTSIHLSFLIDVELNFEFIEISIMQWNLPCIDLPRTTELSR